MIDKIKQLFKSRVKKFKFDPQRFDCIINDATFVNGTISFDGTLRIDGHVFGDLTARVEDESAVVVTGQLEMKKDLTAKVLVICPGGRVICKHKITADVVVMHSGSHVECITLEYKSLSIKDGAQLIGTLRLNTQKQPNPYPSDTVKALPNETT